MVRKVSISRGELFNNSVGDTVEVIDVGSSARIKVKYMDSHGYEVYVTMSQLKAGRFKNPYTPSVWGFGFIGVGEYSPKRNVGAYIAWQGMLQRAYDPKLKARFPTYDGVTVNSEWSNFQSFAKWFEEETKNKPKDQTWHLDKDICRSKEYGPTTCIVVPAEVNCVVLSCSARRGELPVGVSFRRDSNKYRARCHIGIGESISLGSYCTPEEAFDVYKRFKESHMGVFAESYRGIISDRAVEIISNYKVQIDD